MSIMKNKQFQNILYYDHNYSTKLFITIEKYKEIHQKIDIIDFGKKKITYFIFYFIGVFKL